MTGVIQEITGRVTIFLMNGFRMPNVQIAGEYDDAIRVIDANGVENIVFKHAISTIVVH